jgi:hypothetical protein
MSAAVAAAAQAPGGETFVARLIDENAALRTQIVQLSADLRALRAQPGSAEAFVAEIESLGAAVKALQSQVEQRAIDDARRAVEKTIGRHQSQLAANAALPPATRIAQLELSLMTDAERAALRAQRDRVKASIDATFGAERVAALVEDELRRKRREQRERELERESLARGAGVLSTPAAALAHFNASMEPGHSPPPPTGFAGQAAPTFAITKEREERQQHIIANSTPLRAQLARAQEDSLRVLRREMDENGPSTPSARRAELEGLERHHASFMARGNAAAAALLV